MKYTDTDQDLIYIETEFFKFYIKGKPVHPDIEQLYPKKSSNLKAKLEVSPVGCNEIEFWHFGSEELIKSEELNTSVYPFFYEQQDYLIFIKGKDNQSIEFFHENKNIRKAISKTPGENNQLIGNINFKNDVGYSKLEVRGNGETLLIITIEVFPSKIDYRNDYFKLLQEVNNEIYNLAYDFLRRTFLDVKPKEASNITLVEFFSIIRIIFNRFIKAYRRIEKYPHHRLHRSSKVLPAARVKKINRQSIKWLRRNRQFYNKELELPSRMLNIDKQVSFDTFENRFVKWIIIQLDKKLNTFKERYKSIVDKKADEKVLGTVDRMRKKLEFILKNSFLQEVGNIYKIDSLSLVLQMAPGYREVYKYYLMLLKGLSINGQIFKLSMKRIWELYEYWCFLELNRILSERYEMVKQDLIAVNYQGIYVTLNKGISSRIQYRNKITGEEFTLSYNKYEGEKITTGQKPDNVLTLNKKGTNAKFKFIFDAKYRINPAYPGSRYYNNYQGIPGPEEDDINSMHRYRDAIVQSNKDSQERVVVGAFVLFPYKGEKHFEKHHFYKSINKVNVGAFPFLPNSTRLISNFLENIIEESYLANYERNTLPSGSEDYQRDTTFEHNVLVGSLRNRKQFEIMLDKDFYYIPYQKNILNHDLDYIALYQSEKKFGKDYGIKYYAAIDDLEVKKRKGIPVPADRKNLERSYIFFKLKGWKELDNPVKPEGYGVSGSHIYTSIMLLEKAKTIPELSIKTLKEWRTWMELKRIQPEIKVLLDDKKLNSNSKIKGFNVGDMTIKIRENNIFIEENNEVEEFTMEQFLYNLRGVMNRLFK
ncbi:MAG TPA: restriction endonuclease-like protein [Halanaerobiales bacterium]|nr:restriction endonuclease-like protein [Halanaerobiales bacterium]